MRTIGKALSRIIVAVLLVSVSQPVLAVEWDTCGEYQSDLGGSLGFTETSLNVEQVSFYEYLLDDSSYFPEEASFTYDLASLDCGALDNKYKIAITNFGGIELYYPYSSSITSKVYREQSSQTRYVAPLDAHSHQYILDIDGDVKNELCYATTCVDEGAYDFLYYVDLGQYIWIPSWTEDIENEYWTANDWSEDSYLYYKDLVEGSETITNLAGTITYTKDVDYTIDYGTGAAAIKPTTISETDDCGSGDASILNITSLSVQSVPGTDTYDFGITFNRSDFLLTGYDFKIFYDIPDLEVWFHTWVENAETGAPLSAGDDSHECCNCQNMRETLSETGLSIDCSDKVVRLHIQLEVAACGGSPVVNDFFMQSFDNWMPREGMDCYFDEYNSTYGWINKTCNESIWSQNTGKFLRQDTIRFKGHYTSYGGKLTGTLFEGNMEPYGDYYVDYTRTQSGISDTVIGNLDGDSHADILRCNANSINWYELEGGQLSLVDESLAVGGYQLIETTRGYVTDPRVIFAIIYDGEKYALYGYLDDYGWNDHHIADFENCPDDLWSVDLFTNKDLLVKYGDLLILYTYESFGVWAEHVLYIGEFNLRMDTYDLDGNGANDLVGILDGAPAIFYAKNETVGFTSICLLGSPGDDYQACAIYDSTHIVAAHVGSGFVTMFDLDPPEACVHFMGWLYDAMTGEPINSLLPNTTWAPVNGNVTFRQFGAGDPYPQYVLTDDDGFYSTEEIFMGFLSGFCMQLNFTRAADYNEYVFEVYPGACNIYTINASLIPLNFTYNGSAIVGTVNGWPSNEFLDANVTIDNGTWNSSTTTNARGFYMFDNLSAGCYWINATADGYFGQNVSACVNGTNYTIQNFLLSPFYYDVTIAAYDAISGMALNNWTIHIEDYPIDCVPEYDYDYSTTVTNWTLNLSLPYGGYTYTASLSGYYEESGGFFLVNDTNVSIYFYPIGAGIGTYYPPRAVEFRVQTTWGVPIPDVYVTCQIVNTTLPSYSWLYEVLGWPYDSAEEMVGTEMHDYTDTNGQIDFIMVETLKYKMTFTKADPEVNETIYIYPKDEHYKIIVGTHWLEEESVWDDVNYSINISNLNETHAQIDFTYTDGGNLTSELFYWINLTVLTNSTNLYNITYTGYASCESITETFVVARGEAYNIGFIAQHDDAGEIRHSIFIRIHEAAHRLLELEGFPDWIYNLMSIGMLVGIAAIFNRITIRMGAVVVPLCGWGLWFVGWLGWQNSIMPGILSIAATLGVILYIAIGAREKMLT